MNQPNGSFQSQGYTLRELQGDIKVRKKRLIKQLTPSNIKLGFGVLFLILIILLFIWIAR